MVFGPLTGSQFLQGRDQSCVLFIRLCWVPAMMTYLGIKQHSSKSQNQDYIIFGVFPHRGSDCFCHSREILVATCCHEGHLLGQMSGGLTTFINWATERFMVLQNWRQWDSTAITVTVIGLTGPGKLKSSSFIFVILSNLVSYSPLLLYFTVLKLSLNQAWWHILKLWNLGSGSFTCSCLTSSP